MRILLCPSYLGSGQPEPVCFPIGLGYIASMLKGHDVFCWDPNVEENPMIELGKILEGFDPDLVGLSLRNIDSVSSFRVRSYYDPFVSMVKIVKEKAPSSRLIVGGAGFSIFAKEIMERNPEIDFGIVSEGEGAIVNLLKNLDHPERVKNLVVRREDKVIFTGKGDFVDFDSLPPPSREGFDLSKYKKNPFSMGVQSSRGCGFGCIYCLHRFLMGSRHRLRAPKKVVDEIEMLVAQHGINGFYFVDPVFNVPPDHARAICEEIRRRKLGIEWEAAFRPDFLNAKLMMEAVEAGCQLFDFSPDGASDEAMQVLGKNLEVRDVEKTVNWASKIENVKVAYEFVYDLPYGNVEHLVGLTRLFPKIMCSCRNKLQYLTLSKMRIYPYTPLYDIALRQGKINAHTDLLYPVHYQSCSSKNPWNILPHFLRGSSVIFREMCKKLAITSQD